MNIGERKDHYITICFGHSLRYRLRTNIEPLIYQTINDRISISIRIPVRNLTDNTL
jgi:hypothetical protein